MINMGALKLNISVQQKLLQINVKKKSTTW